MLEPFTFDSDFLISYQINYIIFRKWSKATRTLPIFSFILLQQKHLWLLFSMNKSHMWLQIYKYKGANVTFEWLFYFMNWRQMYLQIAFWWKGKATNVTFERFFFFFIFSLDASNWLNNWFSYQKLKNKLYCNIIFEQEWKSKKNWHCASKSQAGEWVVSEWGLAGDLIYLEHKITFSDGFARV